MRAQIQAHPRLKTQAYEAANIGLNGKSCELKSYGTGRLWNSSGIIFEIPTILTNKIPVPDSKMYSRYVNNAMKHGDAVSF